MPAALPPLPASLTTHLLSYLIPSPNPPLPPDLLSTALFQQHQFIPRSLADPHSHFTLASSPSVSEAVERELAEIARCLGAGDHPPLDPEYTFLDPLTLLARLLLHPSPSAPATLALLFMYEGDERGWRFHDLTTNVSDGRAWRRELDGAVRAEERRASAEEKADAGGEEEAGGVPVEGDDAGDFWSGFEEEEEQGGKGDVVMASSSSPTSVQGAIRSPDPAVRRPSFNTRVSSTASLASLDDDYWTKYGGVEDGIAPSAPTTPYTSSRDGMGPWGSSREAYDQKEDLGTYPVFPPPPFKGATPAASPHLPNQSLQDQQDQAPNTSLLMSSSLESTSSVPSSSSSSSSSSSNETVDQPSWRPTSSSAAADSLSLSGPAPVSEDDPLYSTLQGLLQLYVRSSPSSTSSASAAEASARFLDTARAVVAGSGFAQASPGGSD